MDVQRRPAYSFSVTSSIT